MEMELSKSFKQDPSLTIFAAVTSNITLIDGPCYKLINSSIHQYFFRFTQKFNHENKCRINIRSETLNEVDMITETNGSI